MDNEKKTKTGKPLSSPVCEGSLVGWVSMAGRICGKGYEVAHESKCMITNII